MKRIKHILLWLGALLAVALAMLVFEADLLWKVQQYNLFLYTASFFHEQMLVPGGLLSYISCFFTQFLLQPWLGVLMLCGWWLLLMWLVKRAFRISAQWNIISLIPVAILIIANMDLGYWNYFMKLRGYFFVATIGTTIAVAQLWAFRALSEKRWLNLSWIVVSALLGYPLLGAYSLVAVLLMGIWTWRISKNHINNVIISVVALLSIVTIPLLFYRYVYNQTNLIYLWKAALPSFTIFETYHTYYVPYYLLGAFFLLIVICYQASLPVSWQKDVRVRTLQGILLTAIISSVWIFWYKDDNFHHELTMQHCIERVDWEGVLKEGKKQKTEPTRAIVMMHNLALSRLGLQLDEMYNFPKGSKKSNTPLPVYMYHVAGRLIYYQYGLPNECHRMCMEEGVEYGWRLEVLQYMARCSLLSGEKEAARKFLDILRQTHYYSKWAEGVQNLLDHPDQIAEVPETAPITHMMHYDNRLGSDKGYVENFLMSLLADIDSDDPYFQEQAVLAALWKRDAKLFWPRFFQYAKLHPHDKIPRIFQEAAYLFGNLQHSDIIYKIPFNKNVKESYEAFSRQAQQMDGQPIEEVREALYPMFGNTYYFEYYFLKDITYI